MRTTSHIHHPSVEQTTSDLKTPTAFQNKAQGRAAHPGCESLRATNRNGVPQNRWAPGRGHFKASCPTQGALRDPGLCSKTPLAFVVAANLFQAIQMIKSGRDERITIDE